MKPSHEAPLERGPNGPRRLLVLMAVAAVLAVVLAATPAAATHGWERWIAGALCRPFGGQIGGLCCSGAYCHYYVVAD